MSDIAKPYIDSGKVTAQQLKDSAAKGSAEAQRTKNLAVRNATDAEKPIIDALLDVYSNKPSTKAFSFFDDNIIFEDPISIAKGHNQVQSQWNGMPKVFSESTTERCAVLQNDSHDNTSLLLDLWQNYKFRGIGAETLMQSLVIVKHENGKILAHADCWNHEPMKTSADGKLGGIYETFRTMQAKLVSLMVSPAPPDATKP